MESELQPGQTVTYLGVSYVVVSVHGANAVATNPDGIRCLIPIKDVKVN